MMTILRWDFFRASFLILSILGIVSLWTIQRAVGQTPSQAGVVLLTWEAHSYAPSIYPGKVLPAPGSPVTASVEVLDGGKMADLSSKPIYWYLDTELVGGGPGKKTVTINTRNRPGSMKLMVQVPSYKGSLLFKAIDLPVADPKAVIEALYPDRNFSGSSFTVRGVPYFFNVPNLETLNYFWTVNDAPISTAGATSTEGKADVVINVNPDAPIGSSINIKLIIQDPKDRLFYGSTQTTFSKR